MKSLAKFLTIVISGICIFAALRGLYESAQCFSSAHRGVFDDMVKSQGLTYFFTAFYIMSLTCIAFSIILMVGGTGLLFGSFFWSRVLICLFIAEILYFLVVSKMCSDSTIRESVAAASGVGNMGLASQLKIFLPLWAPFVLWWAMRTLKREKAMEKIAV